MYVSKLDLNLEYKGRGGAQKFPELLKQICLKCWYKFETLVSCVAQSCEWMQRSQRRYHSRKHRLIFKGNTVEGRQPFSLNFRNFSETSLVLLQTKW